MNALGLSLLLALSNLVSCQQQESSCSYNLTEIKIGLNASGNVDSFVENCLAHNGTHAEAISISVYYSSQLGSGDDSLRYDFQCVGGTTLIPTLSRYVSNITNPACTACEATAVEPCEARCDELCGSCDRNNISDCTTCRYLRKVDNGKHYCLDGSSCSMQGLNFTMTEEGCECDGYLQLVATHENEPLYLLPEEEFTYRCIGDCVGTEPRPEGDNKFCDVCGVEKCVNCMDDHCTECVSDYRVIEREDEGKTKCITEEEYEEEHITERRDHLRELTEELTREQEHEEEERENTVLLLQILLPIFCILTLVVCIGMSVFTHYWYPYIDEKGKKRIKTKPTEEPEPTVWRPRPTIRFR